MASALGYFHQPGQGLVFERGLNFKFHFNFL